MNESLFWNIAEDLIRWDENEYRKVNNMAKLCLQLIRRRLLPRRFWYYAMWMYRTNRHINQIQVNRPQRWIIPFHRRLLKSVGMDACLNIEFGGWEILKKVVT